MGSLRSLQSLHLVMTFASAIQCTFGSTSPKHSQHCEFSVYHELSLRKKRLKKNKSNPSITGFRLYFPLSGADYSPNLTKIELPHIYGKSLLTVDREEYL